MSRAFFRAILCLAAGLIGWIFTEPFYPKTLGADGGRAEFVMIGVVSLMVGLAAGWHQGFMRGGMRNILFGLALGAVLGTLLGYVGYMLGGGITNALFGPGWAFTGFPLIPRIIAIAAFGAGIGAGIGAATFTGRGFMAGLMGGLIGGAVAGSMFDLIGTITAAPQLLMQGGGGAEVGGPARAVSFALLAAMVGLFTALVDQLTRHAWIRLVVGRNEGREWPVDGVQTTLGRDERAHVPLFGDPNVAGLHAVVIRQGHQYFLQDVGTPVGVGLNGIRIGGTVPLNPGDTFQIGSHQLQFLMKAGAAARAREGRAAGVPVGMVAGPTPGDPAGMRAPMNPIGAAAPATPTPAPTQPMSVTVATPAQPAQPASVAPGYTLVAMSGPLTGQRFTISTPTEVGRECPIPPLGFDSQASRRHARLTPTAQGLQVDDLGSTNGTLINGIKAASATLRPGETVQVGSTIFRVE
jgi:pSer/pThr/pTyr-binding forkhead associated (FHA) protein